SARVATGRVSPRDLIYLRNTLRQIPLIKNRIIGGKDAALIVLGEQLESCADLEDRISKAIVDEPPPSLKDGGVFRDGFDPQLDELRSMAYSGKDWLRNLQQSEAERTGISSLKIGYNKVFGYYLEITNTHKDRVPEEYIRKQTLVNAERYITPELKEYEEKILGAEEQMVRLEAELFQILRDEINERTSVLQQNAAILSTLDALASLAETAVRNRYVRPFVHDGKDIVIEGGRHPVVEQFLPPGEPFIPNDIRLDSEAEQILIITGPNMAGKSVLLRQVGLTVLMAQVGSFVPADKARIGVVDRIFTRVGATDNLAAGESTFLVEMNETANILNSASTSSLILLDEVGRGTSTFDGLSIAWALVEYLHDHARVAARTLFATHYHELNELESRLQRVRNFRIQVQEHGGRVVFLRKLERGSADHSYGIEVARMAGLPEKMLTRAREILLHLESQRLEVEGALEEVGITGRTLPIPEATSMQMSLFTEVSDPVASEIRERVEAMDPDRLTPIDALIALTKLKRLTKDLDQVRSSRDRRP
ncbi:MAG: DNA mismatch repair protein MutS, partial [Bacteroidetes bacterium]|nr:DNA mismatch repair protein MutS [Bacteroidota bacterium]